MIFWNILSRTSYRHDGITNWVPPTKWQAIFITACYHIAHICLLCMWLVYPYQTGCRNGHIKLWIFVLQSLFASVLFLHSTTIITFDSISIQNKNKDNITATNTNKAKAIRKYDTDLSVVFIRSVVIFVNWKVPHNPVGKNQLMWLNNCILGKRGVNSNLSGNISFFF